MREDVLIPSGLRRSLDLALDKTLLRGLHSLNLSEAVSPASIFEREKEPVLLEG